MKAGTVIKRTRASIHIKWVRSGIGFDQRQKEMIRSLGFRSLNQVVERPDTPQVRGLVARLPHLVEVVEPAPQPAWSAVPEYTILPGEAVPALAAAVEPPKEANAPGVAELKAEGEETVAGKALADAPKETAAPAHDVKRKKTVKAVAPSKGKTAKAGEAKETKHTAHKPKPQKKAKK